MAYNQRHNLFQLWDQNGRRVPFKAHKETWGPASSMLVEKIEIGKWPYGTAWGRFMRDGQEAPSAKIANAGTYTWSLVK